MLGSIGPGRWLLAQPLPRVPPPAAWLKVEAAHGPFPDSRVNCLLQDSLGFLWVGSSKGLYRYDGYTFVHYTHHPGHAHGISSDQITALASDPSGDLWIGTANGGLNRYNYAQDAFTAYLPDPENPEALIDAHVMDLLLDRQGDLWIGTFGGLDRMRESGGKAVFQHFYRGGEDAGGRSDLRIETVAQDPAGHIWVGMVDAGIAKMDKLPGEEAKASTWTRHDADPEDSMALGGRLISDMQFDAAGRLHVSHTKGISISRGDAARAAQLQFETYPHTVLDPGRRQTKVNSTYFDAAGDRWLVSAWGIHRAIGKGYASYHLDQMGAVGKGSNVVYTMLIDRDGVIWVGTQEGLYRSLSGYSPFQALPMSPGDGPTTVTAICRDQRGQLWVGMEDNGVLILDNAGLPYLRLRHKEDDPGSLAGNFIMTILEDSRQRMWIGTYGGGLHLGTPVRDAAGKVVRVAFERLYTRGKMDCPLPDPYPYHVIESSAHRIWAGSFYGVGPWDETRHRFDGVPIFVANTVLEDAAGGIWVGSDRGIFRWDMRGDSLQRYSWPDSTPLEVQKALVTCLALDHRGRIWAGTPIGLIGLPAAQEPWCWYRAADGLADNAVRSILLDGQGGLWLGTAHGLSHLDLRTRQFSNYGIGDGSLNLRFTMRSSHRDRAGRLYFGGENGLVWLDPARMAAPRFDPPVVLTGVRLANALLHPGTGQGDGRRTLPRVAPLLDTLHFRHDENVITLEFAALDYRLTGVMRYRYRMEGFDADWLETPPGQHAVTYTNLDPGTYTFEVRAVDARGVQSRQSARLHLLISPPWWRTTAAWLLYVAVGIGLIVLLFRWRVGAIRRRLEVEARIAQARIEERDRVRASSSRDFHDEAGNRLTRMSLYLALLRQQGGPDTSGLVEKLQENVQALSAGMRDFIWVLDPRHDNFPDLLLRLTQFGGELCGAAGIDFTYKNALAGEECGAPDVRTKRHLLLILKEAIHNAVRHAACKHVLLIAVREGDELVLRLQDDGRGFEEAGLSRVNGLRNMRERAVEIGADLQMKSAVGQGTALILRLPCPA